MADLERIRLVVLGGAGVGKSAIIRRLLGQGFSERYRPTVEDLYSRECVLGTLTLKVDLLDTAGDLQFPAMRRLSIATAHAFLLVYATTSLPSFECVKRCFEEVREQRPDFQEVPIVVAGNKLDLAPARREVPIEDVSEWLFCELPKLRAKVMECSAKDDYNIKDIFRCFVTLSRIVPKNPTGESDESGLRRRCSAYGSRSVLNAIPPKEFRESKPLSLPNMDVAKASERLLKLAIPNHLVWLCLFYLTFHSFLNLMGELLHFADRNFYCDWWNANNIDTFWRTWNMPVHRWAVRHLYIPVVEMGYGKTTASVTVFFISAFFHEYLVSVPLKTFKIWAFMGMMGQIPLSVLSKMTERYLGVRYGNMVVWASLIIGQPLCIMMYYHDYVVTHFGESLIEDYSVV